MPQSKRSRAKTFEPFSIRPDARWIRARQDLLRQVKGEVMRRLGPEPSDVKAAQVRYERELRKAWTISGKNELLANIDHVDIVYGGDFHALGQAQRTHLKILRSLSDERSVILALECFPIRSQRFLDQFLASEITVDELRKKSGWDREWGFPWEHYCALFELAKKRGYRLVALNTPARRGSAKGDLAARESKAASVIRREHLRRPASLIYVIFGDLHLAQAHLPRLVRESLTPAARASLRELTIHLNSERIYFQLAKQGLELAVDVVRLGPSQFCVLSSPPWVKWQSYLLFLDQTSEREGDDEEDDEELSEDLDFDPTDQVASLVKLAASDLGLKIKVDDLAVYSEDDEHIWRAVEKSLSPNDRAIARELLTSRRSFFLPDVGVAYLSRSTVNHSASLAGHYLHAKMSGRTRPLWRVPADYPALIWSEAAAYFISKIINHKRQSETLTDLRSQLALLGPKDQGREVLQLALETSFAELLRLRAGRKRKRTVSPRRKSSYLEAARILGGMMGERLYLAYRSRKLKLDEIKAMLRKDVDSRSFKTQYDVLVDRLQKDRSMLKSNETIKVRKERL